jgi:hypothetical protein
MRNLLALAGAALLAFVVVGWFLGWYKVESTDTPNGRKIDIDVNSPKITEDINKAREALSKRNQANPSDANNNTNKQTPNNSPVHQVINVGDPPPGNTVPASFHINPDGTIVFPSSSGTTPSTPPGPQAPVADPPPLPPRN